MPINSASTESLQHFGIPTGSGVQTLMQPKPAYRFRVIFYNVSAGGTGTAGNLALTRNVQRVSRPQIRYPDVAVPAYNSTAYYAGRHEWQPITLAIRDDICSQAILNLTRIHYMQMDHLTQSGAMAATQYKFHMGIDYLDGGNPSARVLESWDLVNCFITDVNYGDLDYERGDGYITIEMTIRYDNAILVVDGRPAERVGALDPDCGLVLRESIGGAAPVGATGGGAGLVTA